MLIELSETNVKLFLFLIYPIFRRIQDFTYKLYIKEGKDPNLFKTFRYFSSFIFSGIFLLIFKYKTQWAPKKKESLKELISKEEEDEEYYESHLEQFEILQQIENKKRKMKSILYLFLLSIIGIVTFFLRYYFYSYYFKEEHAYTNLSIRTFFQIINYSILSYIILKYKLYLHHIVSFGIITIILIVIFFLTLEYITDIILPFIFYFLSELGFALFDVLIKWHMEIFFNNPYSNMFYIGLIVLIPLLLYDIIAYFIYSNASGIIIGFQDNINSVGDFFSFILDLIMEYLWNLGIWLLIFYYTPCHFFISEYISQIFYFIIQGIKNTSPFYSDNWHIFLICYLIILFFCLIFNEVIILNFWNLNYNTKKNIIQRGRRETKHILERVNSFGDSLTDETEQ